MDPGTVLALSPTLAEVLAEIAETASETLELQDVFERVAVSVRELIPFDHMGIVRIVDGHRAVIHASTFPCNGRPLECTEPMPLIYWSPRMRPRPGPNPRIDDAFEELNSSFPIDAQALKGGMRSGMWEPFRPLRAFPGGVWLSAYRPHAFTAQHQALLRPIAALLGSAVEHWRIWDADRRRRDRIDRVENLLGTVAASLDVREVFERLSDEIRPILPHDLMVLTELEVRTRTIRIAAFAGGNEGIVPPDEPVRLTPEELERRVDTEIVHDIPAQVAPDTERKRLILAAGLRSWLRVPVWLSGEVQASLSFLHREPSRFGPEDTAIARRCADRIALMLSHHRLAQEARIAAESLEKAKRLEATVDALARELESRGQHKVVGVSAAWKETLLAVGRVAPTETTVLITGESGTGKEVVAGLLHQGSARVDRPLVAINCAALPEQLLESELFGHEKGAFTGAIASKIGRMEQAAGGTLFLDEITEMSPAVQAKLLRVLEEREFQRVGGSRTIKADVRVIAATNRDPAVALERGTFRQDLYYRLNVFQIHIAPLRERPEDILPLADAFLEELGRSIGRRAAGISRDGREWLLAYPWPGNIRELRNAIERAILLSDGGLITRQHLPAPPHRPELLPGQGAGSGILPIPPGGIDLEAVERSYVQGALLQAKGNKSKAARLLGLSRAQLYSRLEKYGIDRT
jgi:transcriptional regulator with GAF, ATPase, and Fis domain